MVAINSLTVAALGLVGSAAAVGKATVRNNCAFNVTLWSVGSDVSNPVTLKAGGATYSETYVHDPKTGGKSIKVTKEPDGLYTAKPQTNFAYSLDGASVWYDLSDVFGDAFKGFRTVVYSSDKNCPSVVWTNGVPPSGSQVKNCGSNNDLTLSLCAV